MKNQEEKQPRRLRNDLILIAVLLIAVGAVSAWYVVMNPNARILPIALGIFGYTYGSLLGVFLLGMLTKSRGNDMGNIIAMLAGFVAVITLEMLGSRELIVKIAFPWRVTIGTLVTFAVGCCFRTPAKK
jgi:Na+/proline symporter